MLMQKFIAIGVPTATLNNEFIIKRRFIVKGWYTVSIKYI